MYFDLVNLGSSQIILISFVLSKRFFNDLNVALKHIQVKLLYLLVFVEKQPAEIELCAW